MPGLLVTDNSHSLFSQWGIYAVGAEIVGTFLFALLGSSASANQAAFANGLALAVTSTSPQVTHSLHAWSGGGSGVGHGLT